MIIPAQTLRQIKPVEPFVERTIHPNGKSYGLSPAGYDIRIAQTVTLRKRGFALVSSFEKFNIPLDIQAIVHDKSTWARMGLAVQNTVIEPGWRGVLMLELSNGTKDIIRIEEGEPVAQVVFHRLEAPTEQPYQGKYQDQKAGQGPIFESSNQAQKFMEKYTMPFDLSNSENYTKVSEPFETPIALPEIDQPLHTLEQFENLMYKWIEQKAQIMWQASQIPTTDRPYYPIIAACGQQNINDIMTEAVRRGILKSTVIQIPTGVEQELTPHTMYYWGKGEYHV